MKILVHYYRLGHYIGGAEVIALNQCAEFLRQGHSVTILTADVGMRSKIFQEFLEQHKNVNLVELSLDYKNKTGDVWTDINLESYIFGRTAADGFYKTNKEKYDIVVLHLTTDSLFVPSEYKTVVHLHGTPTRFDHLMELGIYNANGILAVSESVRESWSSNVKSFKTNIELIHNGIDTNIFKNNNIVRDIDVLFVGRLFPHKGVMELIEASEQGKFNLVVIGAGPLEEEINKYPKVQHYKNIGTDELVKYYNRAKIFACPSSSREGVLTTMLEASACGCAIVTTNCSGMVDFAIDNDNALLVPPHDSKGLSTSILKLLGNTELRQRLAKKSEYDAVNNWNVQKQTSKLIDFYKKSIC